MTNESLALRPIHHINYLVEDIPAAVDQWVATTGAGPFFWLGEDIEFDESEFRGEPCLLSHGAVIGRWGSIALELTQIHDISPAPFEELFLGNSRTLPRVGHVSFVTADRAAENKRLTEFGMPQFFRARKGPMEIVFHEAPMFGHPVEVHEAAPMAGMDAFLTQAAEDWDGSDPLREMPPPPAGSDG